MGEGLAPKISITRSCQRAGIIPTVCSINRDSDHFAVGEASYSDKGGNHSAWVMSVDSAEYLQEAVDWSGQSVDPVEDWRVVAPAPYWQVAAD